MIQICPATLNERHIHLMIATDGKVSEELQTQVEQHTLRPSLGKV